VSHKHVVVIGAGAFGGWAALALQRGGAKVTLIDSWGAGNTRSSSGGETRLIRALYGPDPLYVRWAAQALPAWRELERETRVPLYEQRGALWLFHHDDGYATASAPFLAEQGLALECLVPSEAKRRFPHLRYDDLSAIYFEPEAGCLYARRACQTVLRLFVAAGGNYLQDQVRPGLIRSGTMDGISLSSGSNLQADTFVFALGPWLGRCFPELLGALLHVTRQDVCFFGLGAADLRQFPVWMDFGTQIHYGVADADGRGFKVGDDTRGPVFDPDNGERTIAPATVARLRALAQQRFPDIGPLPLLETRVCQYENTPDGHFIMDRHPEAENLVLLGGGSGHGFKFGPIVGREMAAALLHGQPFEPMFRLARFQVPLLRQAQLERR
jgi:sarcosine oxidase